MARLEGGSTATQGFGNGNGTMQRCQRCSQRHTGQAGRHSRSTVATDALVVWGVRVLHVCWPPGVQSDALFGPPSVRLPRAAPSDRPTPTVPSDSALRMWAYPTTHRKFRLSRPISVARTSRARPSRQEMQCCRRGRSERGENGSLDGSHPSIRTAIAGGPSSRAPGQRPSVRHPTGRSDPTVLKSDPTSRSD